MKEIKFGNLTQDKKIVVMSDLHLGDPRLDPHRLGLLCTTLRLEWPDVLILAGDVFEENIATEPQKNRFAEACKGIKHVVVLKGNHDSTDTEEFAHRIDATYGECVTGFCGGKSYVVEHGNRFDSAWKRIPGIGHLAIWLNRAIYRLTKFDMQAWFRRFECVIKKLKKQHTKAEAAWPGEAVVVTGHTHIPTGSVFGEGYFNSGDWIYHKSYIVIYNGLARLEHLP